MTIIRGKRVKKQKFEIGDIVTVTELKYCFGKIGYVNYRDAEGATTGWFYKVHAIGGGYQSWPESSLRKLTKKEYEIKVAEFNESVTRDKARIADLMKKRR